MGEYATYELANKLALLNARQREAISRIVKHVYLDNKKWGVLFSGENRICAESNYYRRGKLNEETGEWIKTPGWGFDKKFQDALQLSIRLALQSKSQEEVTAVFEARRAARLATKVVVDELIGIVTPVLLKDGEPVAVDNKARVAAGKVILEYAKLEQAEQVAVTQSGESDWWMAAEGDTESAENIEIAENTEIARNDSDDDSDD